MVTPTRVSPPQSIQMVTRRTTQGHALLRPDALLVQNFYYLLGYLQTIYRIDYHTAIVLANHFHLLLTDVLGDQVQAFNRDFMSLLTRSLNVYWNRTETLWGSGKPNCVHVAPRAEDVIDKSAYINVNAVAAHLVSHAKKWPGVRVLASDMGSLQLRVKRPSFFYDEDGDLPESVVVRFTLPKVWDMNAADLKRSIEKECNRREEVVREQMAAAGKSFVGVKQVKRQSPEESVGKTPERFGLIPHVACKLRGLRDRYLAWRKRRQERYDECRDAMQNGSRDIVFPQGTYLLHVQYGQPRQPWDG